jgi:signal transduction histidine kinase
MFNYKIFIDDIYNVISQKHTFFELLLNITFVLIIFLLIFIFYWDSINRSIIKKNRCKIHINKYKL